MFEFKLPDLGEGVHEGEILDWFVAVGDTVEEDAPLVEIETDKAAVTIPSPRAGKIVSITGKVGDTIAVGAVLVVIDDASASSPEPEPAKKPEPEPAAAPAPAPVVAAAPAPASVVAPAPVAASAPAPAVAAAAVPPAPSAVSAPPAVTAAASVGKVVPAAPATRRLARELGVDLSAVPGSGPAGRVSADDVQRYAAALASGTASPAAASPAASPSTARSAAPTTAVATAAAAAPAGEPAFSETGGSGIPFFEVERLPDFTQWGPVEREPLRSIRRKVAHKMVASMVIVPHVAHMDEADVTELDALRKQLNAQQSDIKYSLLPFIIKAVVAQLRRTPNVNASIDPHTSEIVYKKYYNVGFAADTPKGLLVPVIHDTDRLSINEIAEQLVALADKARAGTLEVDAMRGGTFSITNLGAIGGTFVIPTINYPEVAILGLGRAVDRPVVKNGEIVVRKMLPMTIAYDHRLVDGANAARFLNAVIARLADPTRLLVEC